MSPEAEVSEGDLRPLRQYDHGSIATKYVEPVIVCELCGVTLGMLYLEVTPKWTRTATYCYEHGLVWVEAAFQPAE